MLVNVNCKGSVTSSIYSGVLNEFFDCMDGNLPFFNLKVHIISIIKRGILSSCMYSPVNFWGYPTGYGKSYITAGYMEFTSYTKPSFTSFPLYLGFR